MKHDGSRVDQKLTHIRELAQDVSVTLNQLQDRLQTLSEEKDLLLVTFNELRAELKSRKTSSDIQIAELRAKLKEAEASLSVLNAEIRAEKSRGGELEQRLKTLSSEKEQLLQMVASLQAKAQRDAQALQELKRADTSAAVSNLRNANARLEETARKLHQEKSHLHHSFKRQYSATLKAFETRIQELQLKLSEAQEKIRTLELRSVSSESEKALSVAKTEGLQRELVTQQRNYENSIALLRERIEDLQSELQGAHGQLRTLEDSLRLKREENAALSQRVQMLELEKVVHDSSLNSQETGAGGRPTLPPYPTKPKLELSPSVPTQSLRKVEPLT